MLTCLMSSLVCRQVAELREHYCSKNDPATGGFGKDLVARLMH
jgi:hypothetical protein